MGSFYVNYTVEWPDQAEVADALSGRRAAVSPSRDGCVVVFDEESDEQDTKVIVNMASWLSYEFSCPVLAMLNHDDDVLRYFLYDNGVLVDEYDSAPGYFQAGGGTAGPVGGNAKKLCAAFGAGDLATVEQILRAPAAAGDGYMVELDRHAALAAALGLPQFAVGTAYANLDRNEYPEGVTAADMMRTQ